MTWPSKPDRFRVALVAAHSSLLDVCGRTRGHGDAVEAAERLPVLELQEGLAVDDALRRLALDHVAQRLCGLRRFLQNDLWRALHGELGLRRDHNRFGVDRLDRRLAAQVVNFRRGANGLCRHLVAPFDVGDRALQEILRLLHFAHIQVGNGDVGRIDELQVLDDELLVGRGH
jgi:hypothetical protein